MKRGYPPRSHSGGAGSLVTDNLHDLDMELELLKRKRLMIERQQQMLSNEIYDAQPFQRSQPQYDQHQNYGQSRNFSHLYDDGRQGGRDSQFGQNYQSVGHSWELTPSNQYFPQSTDNRGFSFNSKTFPPKPRNAPKNKNFNQQNKSFKNAQPFKSQYVPPPNKPSRTGPVHNVKNNFNPTKIIKPKNKNSYHAPNNLNQQPLASRKALVAQAIPLAKTKPDPSKESGGILSPFAPRSAKDIGRIELAMGTLLKEAREKFSISHPEYFTLSAAKYRKELKRELRLRIRKVLLGKVVPKLQQILEAYRAEFPEDTDDSLMDLCLSLKLRPEKISMKLLPEEGPEEYFKFHYRKSFENQIDKLLNKVTEIQKQKNNRDIDDIIADLPDIFVEEKSNVADEEVKAAAEQSKDVESTKEDIATNASANKSTDETLAEETEVQKNPTAESEKADQLESDAANASENDNHSKQEVIEIKESDGKKILDPKEKVKFYKDLVDQLLERSLRGTLSKRKNLKRIFNISTSYTTSRAGILLTANKMAESLNKLPSYVGLDKDYDEDSQNQKASNTKTPPTETTPTGNKIMYYVKVVGKPSLPDKKIMKMFIDTYNPKTIKKHKHVHNLLFIGFASKADQEMILSANGTTVGNKKLVITKSDKFHGANGAPKENDKSINTSVDLDNGNASIKEESQCDEAGNVEMANKNNENVIDSKKNDTIEKVTEEKTEEGLQITTIKEELETSNTGNSEAVVATSQETTQTIETQGTTATIETQEPTPAKELVETNNDNAETGVKNDAVESVKEDVPGGRSTPTRASARLGTATPSTVRTRRASKLAQ